MKGPYMDAEFPLAASPETWVWPKAELPQRVAVIVGHMKLMEHIYQVREEGGIYRPFVNYLRPWC